MDTRKLEIRELSDITPGVENAVSVDFKDGTAVLAHYVDRDHAAELVKRWNAYPELMRDAKQHTAEVLQDVFLNKPAPPPQDGVRAYTVVLRYEDPDDFRNNDDHVFAGFGTSPELAADAAIASLLDERGVDVDEDKGYDEWAKDYTVIAIYEGELVNLVQ